MLVAAPLTVIASAAAAATGQRLDLRVLVVTNRDYTIEALRTAMADEGVPMTVVDLGATPRPTIDAAFLSDEVGGVPRGKFEAVVLPNDNPAGLSADELAAIVSYEQTFGVRQVNTYNFPHAGVGLNLGGWSGGLDGMTATVTAAGQSGPFSYLSGTLPIDDYDPTVGEAFGYLATADPSAPGTFVPLVEAPIPGGGTGSMIGEFTGNDGRQQLVMTINANAYQTYFRALTHGIITWATRGVHLGHSRSYLTVQVDDIFAYDSAWSAANNCTPGEDCPADVTTTNIRMTADDVTAAVAWQQANDFKLVFAYNGEESVSYLADHPEGDPLTAALLANKDQFSWLNHTYSHEFLGCVRVYTAGTDGKFSWDCQRDADGNIVWVSQATIEAEIQQNIAFAQANGISINPSELLTGEHSGLFFLPQIPTDNPNFVAAVNHLGIKVTGADASRDPNTRAVGGASTFPRHPMSLWFNVSSEADEVDEYNYIFGSVADNGSGFCEQHPDIMTCIDPLPTATGFDGYIVPTEVRFDLMDMLTNDARPLYVHAPNLTGDRMLYTVLDQLLAQYHGLYNASAPFVQPSVTDLTNVMVDQQAWKNGGSDAVEAYVLNGQVVVSSPTGARDVPITVPEGTLVGSSAGPLYGEAYAGERSAWTSVGASPLTLNLPGTFSQAASQTTVASSPNPSTPGQAVTVTATVAPVSPAVVVPTGTVQFRVDGVDVGSPVTLSNGTASFAVAGDLAVGTHPIAAVYSGDTLYTPSTGSVDQVVAKASTTTALLSGTNPSAFGQSVTFTATVAPVAPATAVPTGTVQFQVDGANFGLPVTLVNGVATSSLTFSVGTKTVNAVYSGDAANNPSTGTLSQVVNKGAAATTLASSLNPSTFAQAVTFTATVAPVIAGTITPTGTVQFKIDNVNSGAAVALVAGKATFSTSTLTAVNHTISAVYNGDALYTTSTGNLTQGVKPALTAVSPNTLAQGQTRTVTVTGNGFRAGATASFSGTGVTVSSVTVNSATLLTLNVAVASTATTGARTLTVTNTGGTAATLANGLTIVVGPSISSITPKGLRQGASAAAVTITGANFVSGATVAVSGTGVTVSAVRFNSATSLTATMSVSSTAGATARNITVTNPNGSAGTCTSCLAIYTNPVVTSVSPNWGRPGQTSLSVAINGSGFDPAFTTAGGTVSFGSGITVNSVSRTSASTLTAVITVSSTATLGYRNVTVTGPGGGTSTLTNGFRVVVAPTISSISPTSIRRTSFLATITINGTNFQSGARATFSGSGLTVWSTSVNSSTRITVTLLVSSSAATGARNVTVTNPDGGSVTRTGGLTITTRAPGRSAARRSPPKWTGGAAPTRRRPGRVSRLRSGPASITPRRSSRSRSNGDGDTSHHVAPASRHGRGSERGGASTTIS
jgi:hypothetical protein